MDEKENVERVREMARMLDCFTEEDFCLLAGITPGTAEAWRKRGKGPSYSLIGNRYLYPVKAVAALVADSIRERRTVPAKSLL